MSMFKGIYMSVYLCVCEFVCVFVCVCVRVVCLCKKGKKLSETRFLLIVKFEKSVKLPATGS